jgi:hypothetical protein
MRGISATVRQDRPKLLAETHKGVSRPKLLEVIASVGYVLRGSAVDLLPGKSDPLYAEDRTYLFSPLAQLQLRHEDELFASSVLAAVRPCVCLITISNNVKES